MSPTHDLPDDLFALAALAESASPTGLIQSPAVDEAAAFLENRNRSLGSVLTSDRAIEYIAILRAFADFRAGHEPEPLHEDLMRAVCGEEVDASAQSAFKSDLRQLKDWGIVAERIEKERLRGYRDTRRTKYRYRMCDDAVAFVEWLAEMRRRDLDPHGDDVTGNLLDLQRSLVGELRRMLHRTDPEKVTYDEAGDILFRIDRVGENLDATVRTLLELNLRLLGFAACEFDVAKAKEIVGELGAFLERFGRRFGTLREDILRDIEEMRRPCHEKRWAACAAQLAGEAAKFKYIGRVRIPDAGKILADAAAFYGAGGTLAERMARVGDSARKVWGRLNAKLRELERRNHRLEDLGARIAELATLGEDDVPYRWMRRLLECASMRGDLAIRPGGEKALPPRPKLSSSKVVRKTVFWITARKIGEKANVASIAQVRGERLKQWMEAKGVYPAENGTVQLSSGAFSTFEDAVNLLQTMEYTRLGNGEKGRRLLGIEASGTGVETYGRTTISVESATLTFDELRLKRCDSEISKQNAEF